jgi:CubicO group peptidase (beta-lactamase class C family)
MKIHVSIILIALTTISFSQTKENKNKELETKLDSLITNTMEKEHIVGASYIIVKDGKTFLKKGYGFTTLGENMAYVNPDSTIFRIGSISKTFTTLALLQQVDRGNIKLTDDINNHLALVKVPNTFVTPVTPHHLLTHSAGFDEIGGRRVFEKNKQITLSKFLNSNLTRIREPGKISAYSTYGIALAGLLIENLSNLSLENYMQINIWKPLGMTKTSFDIPEKLKSNLSLGYEMYNGINLPQPWEWYHTYPASSINSTTSDMGKYLKMLLNNGAFNNQSILSKKMTLSMKKQQLSIHPEVYGFAYGFYEKNQFGLKAYNHGGDMLGYSSFITLVPEINLGIFIVHHHENTNLRNKVISQVLEHFGTKNNINPNPKRMHNDVSKFAGNYKWMSNCYTCLNSEQQSTYKLTANDDNTLSGFGRKFYQVESLLFKSYDGKRIMGFKENENGKIKYMSLGNVNAFEKVE